MVKPAARMQPGGGSLAESVRSGLCRSGQKMLQCKYLYDEVGSALFEVISVLPEYGLTRAGERLVRQYAEDVVRRLPIPVLVAELGSGNGRNTRWVLEALSRRQRTLYCPIEISPTALAQCERELRHLEQVSVLGCEREYLDGLHAVAARRAPGEHLLVLFLGSTIGNFEREAAIDFLKDVRRTLSEGDALLLAADLVKPESQLLPAYDDPIGVTAAFNLNLLARLNRELGADFEFSRFRHEARFNAQEGRIEMHLRSLSDQTVTIPAAGISVRVSEDETIWTESSYKYTVDQIEGMVVRSGFRCDVTWVDQEWPFAQSLCIAV
jgi:dimethylhistidine N-methyltransferase